MDAGDGEVNEQKLVPPRSGFLAGTYGQVLGSLVQMQILPSPQMCWVRILESFQETSFLISFAEGAMENF